MLMGKLRHGEEKQLTQGHMTASKQAACLLIIYYIGLAQKFLWVFSYDCRKTQNNKRFGQLNTVSAKFVRLKGNLEI